MMSSITPRKASQAFVQLMPQIIRGIALDFFIKKGVTQTQFLVLMAIHSYERCCMGRLARSMQIQMPTATGIVDRLVQAGLVERVPHPEDRRQVLVELKPKGRRFIEQFHEVVRRRWEEVLGTLKSDELETFYDVISKLKSQLQVGQ